MFFVPQRLRVVTPITSGLTTVWMVLTLTGAFTGILTATQGYAQELVFSRDILPILSENCFSCHGPDAEQRQADLRLDTEDGVKSAIHHETDDDIELIRRITSTDAETMMPPPDSGRKLTPSQVARLKKWIQDGAVWGRHWSFERLQKPAVPEPVFTEYPVHNPIDHFVQQKLKSKQLTPSLEADRRTLIRRASLDLTGLPPSPEDVRLFLNDTAPDAYERLIDRLLERPTYGERMAWDWLDAARYADSNGYQGDNERTMWPWRDWVVKAFNENLPFDQFTVWQLAGDLLPDATTEQKLATGFCRNHMINGEGGRIAEENRVDYVMDMTETMGTVWMGLTLNCCRCHDHKFDPLSQQNYFELFAFFNQTPVDGGGGNAQTPPVLALPNETQKQELHSITAQLQQNAVSMQQRRKELLPEQPTKENTSQSPEQKLQEDKLLEQDPEYARLKAEREALQKTEKELNSAIPKVMVMEDRSDRRTTFILNRGLYNEPTKHEVTAALPVSLPKPAKSSEQLNRLDLARWLVSQDHPLTARVIVNRFWQQMMGAGLVRTPEDFGVQSEYPEYHELLDWMSAEFRESGWDVKRLLRTIVLSHTYRQSSFAGRTAYPDDNGTPQTLADVDPDNRLLARAPRFRMPAWMLRDQALSVSGLISRKLGGPSVNTYQPAGVWEEATFGNKKYSQDHGESLYRRSLYIFWRRIVGPTMFFDNATRQTCTVRVLRTNTPLHSLLTLNETTYVEAARVLAERLLLDHPSESDADRVRRVFEQVVCRPPIEEETQILTGGLERSRAHFQDNVAAAEQLLKVGDSVRNAQLAPAEHAAWTTLCLAVLNLDETLTRE